MMTDCFAYMDMNGMGWMMLAGGLFWLLVLALLALSVAALVKYLRTDRNSEPDEPTAAMQPGEAS